MKSSDIFRLYLNTIGANNVNKIYRKSESLIYKWAEDKASSGTRNPLDRLNDILNQLAEGGNHFIIESTAQLLFSRFGYEFYRKSQTDTNISTEKLLSNLARGFSELYIALEVTQFQSKDRTGVLRKLSAMKGVLGEIEHHLAQERPPRY